MSWPLAECSLSLGPSLRWPRAVAHPSHTSLSTRRATVWRVGKVGTVGHWVMPITRSGRRRARGPRQVSHAESSPGRPGTEALGGLQSPQGLALEGRGRLTPHVAS